VTVSSTLLVTALPSQLIRADCGEPTSKIARPWNPVRLKRTGTAAPARTTFRTEFWIP